MNPELGQFFTPAAVAERVVDAVAVPESGTVRVLDLGAGVGALVAALADRIADGVGLEVVAVEKDPVLVPHLRRVLAGVDAHIIEGDALELAAAGNLAGDFDVVVMNPPYAKIGRGSRERQIMDGLGVAVPNIYAAFMALGWRALRPGGQFSAIVPRSWANGTYFRRFRRQLLDELGLTRIHAFSSRSELFCDAGVLQETIIVGGRRGRATESVELVFDDAPARPTPMDQIVVPGDDEQFVRIPTGAERALPGEPLGAVGLEVSTGKIVGFRARDMLVDEVGPRSTPMIYPANIRKSVVTWPRPIGKPQAFACPQGREKVYLSPPGFYVLVKRFSSKEERRRIVAAIYQTSSPVAYDNKLNVIACPDGDVARGLAVWLNSTAVDDHFRTFSGHTQVNAGDLRAMPYPAMDELRDLGRRTRGVSWAQDEIDDAVEELL